MSTMYKDLVNNYGSSQSIEEFAKKGQLVGAMNSKTIWAVSYTHLFAYAGRNSRVFEGLRHLGIEPAHRHPRSL